MREFFNCDNDHHCKLFVETLRATSLHIPHRHCERSEAILFEMCMRLLRPLRFLAMTILYLLRVMCYALCAINEYNSAR